MYLISAFLVFSKVKLGIPMLIKRLFTVSVAISVAACASLAESTNTLSDEKILSQTAGALGYAPKDLTITSRRTEGTNTYVDLKTKDKKEFVCVLNGGNLLTFGMTNPPSCNRKGEPIKTNPFQR